MNNCPIGIFDSGVGGLSVFAELIKLLPEENYIYFGDTKNCPYGNKTKEQLIDITKSILEFFRTKNVKAVVMACNTTSAAAYEAIKTNYNFKIYPIVQTVSGYIARKNYKNIGVFATNATVNSHAYKTELKKYNPNCNIYETACPDWVDIVENELQNEEKSIQNVKTHMDEMLCNNIDKIILGCTHYPYLINVLKKFAPEDLFINPAEYFAKAIAKDLKENNLLSGIKKHEPMFFVSSNPGQFKSASKLFYNVNKAEEISVNQLLVKYVRTKFHDKPTA